MKLIDILENVKAYEIFGEADLEIRSLSQDSRDISNSQTLYFAIKGSQLDGHDYISKALGAGAVAVVCESLPEVLSSEKTYILVQDSVEAMGQMVPQFFDRPSEKLKVLAVTGTNGKTSVATLLYQSLIGLGEKAALFSTAGDYIQGRELPSDRKASSSMEMIEFHSSLAKAHQEGCSYVCIEATSHALDQRRMGQVNIAGAVYTNLSQDHLDYHGTMDKYAEAKRKLFNLLSKDSFAVVNLDDSYAVSMISSCSAKILSYGNSDINNSIERDHTFSVQGMGVVGTSVLFNENQLDLPAMGEFSMYNALSVYICLVELGYATKDIIVALESSSGAKGRMEILSGKNKEGLLAVVDYAHTPDALENVLKTLNKIKKKKIISVLGVGGDRDKSKRPIMGKIAVDLSDQVIFTSDNPRFEEPELIIDDIVDSIDSNLYQRNSNRSAAIKQAFDLAGSGDIILIAGKGHEEYQDVKGEKSHFSDQEEIKRYL